MFVVRITWHRVLCCCCCFFSNFCFSLFLHFISLRRSNINKSHQQTVHTLQLNCVILAVDRKQRWVGFTCAFYAKLIYWHETTACDSESNSHFSIHGYGRIRQKLKTNDGERARNSQIHGLIRLSITLLVDFVCIFCIQLVLSLFSHIWLLFAYACFISHFSALICFFLLNSVVLIRLVFNPS